MELFDVFWRQRQTKGRRKQDTLQAWLNALSAHADLTTITTTRWGSFFLMQPWLGYTKQFDPAHHGDILRFWLAAVVQEERRKITKWNVRVGSVFALDCAAANETSIDSTTLGFPFIPVIIFLKAASLTAVKKISARKAKTRLSSPLFFEKKEKLRMDAWAQVDGQRRHWGDALVKLCRGELKHRSVQRDEGGQ